MNIDEAGDTFYDTSNITNIDHIKFKDFLTTNAFKNLGGTTLTSIENYVFSKILVYHKAVMILYDPEGDKTQILEQFLPQVDIFVYKAAFESKMDLNLASILKIKEEPTAQLWIVDFTDVNTDVKKYKLVNFDFKKLKGKGFSKF